MLEFIVFTSDLLNTRTYLTATLISSVKNTTLDLNAKCTESILYSNVIFVARD